MNTPGPTFHLADPSQRLAGIEQARRAILQERSHLPAGTLTPWVERSWTRCLQWGLNAQNHAVFGLISPQHSARTQDANVHLVQSARPILEKLGRAIVNTRYFAILTNCDGVVVDTSGAIDHSDPRAHLLTRVGTDLSERSVGTTAISAALLELTPVWLHRGEHFFSNTAVYSCAGAPLIGPDGACVGMLDVTGIDTLERPELKHLVAQTASRIENALVLAQTHRLLLRLNWPGNSLGSEADGMVCLDSDGWITAANRTARQMVPNLSLPGHAAAHTSGQAAPVHVSEVFGMPYELLFDALGHSDPTLEIPLWNGLRLNALPIAPAQESQVLHASGSASDSRPLRDIETALIRRAVDQAHGNVTQAAQVLGISRATVYRKLAQKHSR